MCEDEPKSGPLSPERLASLSNLLVNRRRLASPPRSVKSWWCSSSSKLEFDESRFVKEALLTSDDEEIREQPMGDSQGKMRCTFGQVEDDGACKRAAGHKFTRERLPALPRGIKCLLASRRGVIALTACVKEIDLGIRARWLITLARLKRAP